MKKLAELFCKVEGCDERHYGHGYCVLHYGRWRRQGDPLKVRVHPNQIFLRSSSLKRPDLTQSQITNICAIFSGIRA